jgi:hypothetical protein
MMIEQGSQATDPPLQSPQADPSLLHELVDYLRRSRTQLREEWVRRITEAQLLRVMTPEEIFSEVTAVYDNYVDTLETGSVETLQAYARDLSERIIPRGVETHEVLGIVLPCAMSWRARSSRSTSMTASSSIESSTPTSRRPTGSPSPSALASSRNASVSSASSRRQSESSRRLCSRCARGC